MKKNTSERNPLNHRVTLGQVWETLEEQHAVILGQLYIKECTSAICEHDSDRQ